MTKPRISLMDFFRSKSSEETKKEGQKEGEKKEGESTPAGDEGGEGEGESGEGQKEETPKDSGKAEADENAMTLVLEGFPEHEAGTQVVCTYAEFEAMRTDASAWRTNKAELETLQKWKTSMDGLGGGQAKGDQNKGNGKSKPSVFDAPWNQEAIEAAEKLK